MFNDFNNKFDENGLFLSYPETNSFFSLSLEIKDPLLSKKRMLSDEIKDEDNKSNTTIRNLYFAIDEEFHLSNDICDNKETEEIINYQTNNKMSSSTKSQTNNKIENINISYERSGQKDNFSLKLFKRLNDWIVKAINSQVKELKLKVHRPNYDVFTHNTNLIDICFYLNIKFKNLLALTQKDKEALDQLLVELEIKKPYKKKKSKLTQNSKDFKNAVQLLKICGYLQENKEINEKEINTQIIELLKKEGYKHSNDNSIYKKDKNYIKELLIKKVRKELMIFKTKIGILSMK